MSNTNYLSLKTTAYGFKTYPLVCSLPDFLGNRHRFFDWTTRVLADCPSSTAFLCLPGNVQGVITSNPLVVEHMLKSNFDNYPKGARSKVLLQEFLGTGIFNTDGEDWKIQRKIASHEFNTKSLKNFVVESVAFELQARLVPILESAAETGRVLDFQDILEKKKLQKSIAIVHDFADKIIRARMGDQRGETKDEDLLSRFIGNTQNNSPEFLRDIVISFILAGRDTTSSALSWFFWLLSSRPDVEERILNELENIRRQNRKLMGDTYSFDEPRELQYLQAAISEAMRLYPPVPIDTKSCENDDILPDGTFIGKNWFMSYHTYAMGRMENIWGKDCSEYKPERWLENGICKQESPFKFPVFHAGPRMCLGKDMAYIQMKSVAALVLQRFGLDVLLEKGKCPEYLISLTVRMKDGLPVRVKERIL
ncbi:hypothetical protein Pfo_000135 [Paulownia fortunei]|nr:hypothetical protein Pfo_000135 [Paulownia fortunei]